MYEIDPNIIQSLEQGNKIKTKPGKHKTTQQKISQETRGAPIGSS